MQAESLRKAEKTAAAQKQFSKTFEMFAPTEPVDATALSGPAIYARRGGLESARNPESDEEYCGSRSRLSTCD